MARGSGEGKEKLLESAASLFGKENYGAVTVTMLLDEPGLQPPTLYYHFGDKEGLFVAWAERAFTRIEQVLPRAHGTEDSTAELLTKFGQVLLANLALDLRQFMRDAESLSRNESRQAALTAYANGVYSPLCEILLRGVERQEIQIDRLPFAAETYLAGLFAAFGAFGEDGESAAREWAVRFVRGFSA
ncbi:MAG: TetR/AcrR family transcriptional regulator [Armatimonadetes bacterium]|nr:TetR/AcrR family transcriptional regulator [Armatimonadota bacterium]